MACCVIESNFNFESGEPKFISLCETFEEGTDSLIWQSFKTDCLIIPIFRMDPARNTDEKLCSALTLYMFQNSKKKNSNNLPLSI